jgi:hypothetical protein
MGKLDFNKIKNFYSAKDSVKRKTRQPTFWEKIFLNKNREQEGKTGPV